MKKSIIATVLFISSVFIFSGCSGKSESVQEYNKPAKYWYNKMIKQISNYQLDEADDTFTSLEAEHRNSILIPSAMMIIASAHMKEEEYLMANYYFDEYLKRFSLKKEADYIRYLKIKSNFMAFKSQFREQKLLDETLKETNEFLMRYPKSEYIHLVQSIKSRLLMARAMFDKEISELYERVDKPKAQEFYQDKAKESWAEPEQIKDANTPWYRAIFE